MKIAVCDDDKGCLDSMKQLLAEYPGSSRTECWIQWQSAVYCQT